MTPGSASASPFLDALDKLFSSLNQALGNRILPALLRSLPSYVQRELAHASEPLDAPVVPVAPEPVVEPPADAPPVAVVPAASPSAAQPDEVSPGDPNAEGTITEAGVRVYKPVGTTYTQNTDGTFTIASQFSHGSSSVTGSAQSLGLTNTVSPTQRRANYRNTANALAVSSPLGGVIGDTMMATGDFVGAAPDIPDSITSGVDWTSTGASAGTSTGLFGNVVDTASQGPTDLSASDAGHASQMAWLDSLGGNAGSTTKEGSSQDSGGRQRDLVDAGTNSSGVQNAVGGSVAAAPESSLLAMPSPIPDPAALAQLDFVSPDAGAGTGSGAGLTFAQSHANLTALVGGPTGNTLGGLPNSGDPVYDAQIARMNNELDQDFTSQPPNPNAFRVEIDGVPSYDEYNAAQIQAAEARGDGDLSPTLVNAARLDLWMTPPAAGGESISLADAMTYGGDPQGIMAPASMGQKFVTGIATGLWKGLTELPLEATDMSTALWNASTGDDQFVGYSMLGQKAMTGTGTAGLLWEAAKNTASVLPPVAAVRSAYDFTEAAQAGDPEAAGAAFAGVAASFAGAMAMGYDTTAIVSDGLPKGPGSSQMGAISGFRLAQLYPNQLPGTLTDEIATASSSGVSPVSPSGPGFDALINRGTIKYAVTASGDLMVIPNLSANGTEISHAVMTGGQPVIAAGEAEIAGNAQDGYIGLDINAHSGHFMNGNTPAQNAAVIAIAKNAFAKYGIGF